MALEQLNLFGDEEEDKPEEPTAPAPIFKLNVGQQAAVDFLVPFSLGRTEWWMCLLEGYAGTGKTFTSNRVVEAVRKVMPMLRFGMTAPTHKAVRQLFKHSELKDQLEFRTLHSFLKLKEKLVPDPKNPRKKIQVFVPDTENPGLRPIDSIDVLILDESSMLLDELFEYVWEVVRSRKLRVIFMGDGLQIPPVMDETEKIRRGHSDAIPFIEAQRKSRKIHRLVLDEIVRQGAGNPIIEYATEIRHKVRQQDIGKSTWRSDEKTGVEELAQNGDAMREMFKRYFCTPEFEADPDYAKVIAYRNATVAHINNEIRWLIYGSKELPRILVNDKLVLNKPYFIDKKTMLANNEELIVNSVSLGEFMLKYKIIKHDMGSFAAINETDVLQSLGTQVFEVSLKVYVVKATAMNGFEYTVRILHESADELYEDIRKRTMAAAYDMSNSPFERSAMWRQYYDLEKAFLWFTYNYCLTAHKAQGSTYDNAISMEWDIAVNRDLEERNRIRYVAATRARYKLYVVR